VVANETVVGRALIDAVKRRADDGPVSVHVICPQNEPKHGFVIYDDTVRHAAENRLEMTIAQLREVGVEATGELMDPDPYAAVMDAVRERDYDEIVISTHPETRSGWLRQGLVARVKQDSGLPVEHVVVDLDAERDEALRTLVVANQTVGGQELFELLKEKAAEKPRRFVVIAPQGGGPDELAHERLANMLEHLEEEGLEAIGQVVHPDPFTAIQNALQAYAPDEVVISTFPAARSGWLRSDLIERVRASTSTPVEHVISETQEVEG
jgi:nucleotide-binding universal stress UspA family protein